MLIDDKKHIRMLAPKRVDIAKATRSVQPVRVFIVPKVDFQCEDCIDLIDWTDSITIAPPLLQNLSNQTLKSVAENLVNCLSEMVGNPCHFQAVKQLDKIDYRGLFGISDANQRDGMVKAEVESRTQYSRPRPGHKKIRSQGQPFQGQSVSKPRTGMLDVKAKNQEHRHKRYP